MASGLTVSRRPYREGTEDGSLKILGVRHTGKHFDQPRLHVVAEAVDPPFAGIVEQRHVASLSISCANESNRPMLTPASRYIASTGL